MKWRIALAGARPDAALHWATNFFGRYDTSLVEWLHLNQGQRRYQGVYGRCFYPTKTRPMFRISCFLPGPFPCDITTRQKPLYAQPDGTFPAPPSGFRRGVLCYDPRSGRKWYRLIGATRVRNLDEAVVWIVAHEAFHFLRFTRQIPGRNNEIEADRFADRQLELFRTAAWGMAPIGQAALVGVQ